MEPEGSTEYRSCLRRETRRSRRPTRTGNAAIADSGTLEPENVDVRRCRSDDTARRNPALSPLLSVDHSEARDNDVAYPRAEWPKSRYRPRRYFSRPRAGAAPVTSGSARVPSASRGMLSHGSDHAGTHTQALRGDQIKDELPAQGPRAPCPHQTRRNTF